MSQSILYTRRSDEFANGELQQILHTLEFMQIGRNKLCYKLIPFTQINVESLFDCPYVCTITTVVLRD